MYNDLSFKKQRQAYKKNKDNLKEIFRKYWDIEFFQVVYESETIEKERYRYKTKEIMREFGMNSQFELIFLIFIQSAILEGACKFCGEEYYTYHTRGGSKSTHCEHKGLCIACKKPYKYGNDEECSSCCERRPSRIRERNERDYRICLEYHLFNSTSHDVIDAYKNEKEIEWAINFLKNKIKLFQDALKFSKMDEE